VSALVVEIDNLSVAYQMYSRPIDQLKELVLGGIRHETFWALRDISLKIREGEKLGIVGPNGAGKSTLLKVIAGTIKPASGRVLTYGRISSLLTMVPAWNAEETGVENIRFNLLLNGISDKRIPSLIDDIADFTELGPFLFHPVKTYSTGMGARLSFAIATATEPDILIIDEVLGTGDGYFAWKASKRMEAFCERGRVVILVSHSMAAIQSMCDRTIWMQHGGILKDGPTIDVLSAYELHFRRAEDEALRHNHAIQGVPTEPRISELTDANHIRFRIVPCAPFFSSHYIMAIGVQFNTEERFEVPLEPSETSDQMTIGLDTLNSEWGRLHEKDGKLCRILSRSVGRNFGGQFIARRPITAPSLVKVDFLARSEDTREELRVEMLDMSTGEWQPLPQPKCDRAGSSWRHLTFRSMAEEITLSAVEKTVAAVHLSAMPSVEVEAVQVVVGGVEATYVEERQDFAIRVTVRFNRAPKLADVCLRLTRADGLHAFWQSTGLDGRNLSYPEGIKYFLYRFEPNLLGAGEYHVSIAVTNGWRFPDNFPHSEVLARKINACSFRVTPELGIVNFGAVNYRVPIDWG
jgi:lipopolysaccharide transport system ATP-binding protein